MTRMSPAAAFALANQHFAAGRLTEAEAVCRALTTSCPEEPEAFKLLGVIAYMTGRTEEAVALMSRAAELAPAQPEYPNNLSVMLAALGQYEAAAERFAAAAASKGFEHADYALVRQADALSQ